MDNELFQKTLKIVQDINNNLLFYFIENAPISNKDSKDLNYFLEEVHPFLTLNLYTNGEGFGIEFANIPIWDSENDDREYDNEIDDYVSIEKTIRNRLKRIFKFFKYYSEILK